MIHCNCKILEIDSILVKYFLTRFLEKTDNGTIVKTA